MQTTIKPKTEHDPNSIGHWHRVRTYKILDNKNNTWTPTLKVASMITGCGIAQMLGVLELTKNKDMGYLKNLFEQIKEDYKVDGAGCILATLGQNYYDIEPLLLELGFKLLNEYQNYRHGNSYKQRLYSLTY